MGCLSRTTLARKQLPIAISILFQDLFIGQNDSFPYTSLSIGFYFQTTFIDSYSYHEMVTVPSVERLKITQGREKFQPSWEKLGLFIGPYCTKRDNVGSTRRWYIYKLKLRRKVEGEIFM